MTRGRVLAYEAIVTMSASGSYRSADTPESFNVLVKEAVVNEHLGLAGLVVRAGR